MQYIQYIEESQIWKCPKSGKWKVICVGGGSSGGGAFIMSCSSGYGTPSFYGKSIDSFSYDAQIPGGMTSFGTYLSANGGDALDISNSRLICTLSDTHSPFSDVKFSRGQNGFDGISKYSYNDDGPLIINSSDSQGSYNFHNSVVGLPVTGEGYGAGGGSMLKYKHDYYLFQYSYTVAGSNTSYLMSIYHKLEAIHRGLCGKVKTTILDLNESQEIPITIGSGGKIQLSSDSITNLCNKIYNAPIIFNNNPISKSALAYYGNLTMDIYGNGMKSNFTDGKDGVVILQYLGD